MSGPLRSAEPAERGVTGRGGALDLEIFMEDLNQTAEFVVSTKSFRVAFGVFSDAAGGVAQRCSDLGQRKRLEGPLDPYSQAWHSMAVWIRYGTLCVIAHVVLSLLDYSLDVNVVSSLMIFGLPFAI